MLLIDVVNRDLLYIVYGYIFEIQYYLLSWFKIIKYDLFIFSLLGIVWKYVVYFVSFVLVILD